MKIRLHYRKNKIHFDISIKSVIFCLKEKKKFSLLNNGNKNQNVEQKVLKIRSYRKLV